MKTYLPSGMLTKKVLIQRYNQTDERNESSVVYKDYCYQMAAVKPMSTKMISYLKSYDSSANTEFRFNFFDLQIQDRIIHGDVIYFINEIRNVDEEDRYLIVNATNTGKRV